MSDDDDDDGKFDKIAFFVVVSWWRGESMDLPPVPYIGFEACDERQQRSAKKPLSIVMDPPFRCSPVCSPL